MRGVAGEPAPIIRDQLISVWKDSLTSDRKEGVRHITSVNEQDGLPFTMKLVF
jgi:hypothetical protein